MGDFCSISLCAVLHMIVAKGIANGFKYFLPLVISKTQSHVFLPKHLITNYSVLISFKMVLVKGSQRIYMLQSSWIWVKVLIEWNGFFCQRLRCLFPPFGFISFILNGQASEPNGEKKWTHFHSKCFKPFYPFLFHQFHPFQMF